MGDRGNIVIHDEGEIYLYTHWRGSELPTILQAALRRGESRWDDPSYLTRIIFDEMTEGDRNLTGFGISTYLTDGDDQMVHVFMGSQTVEAPRGIGYTFQQFAAHGASANIEPNRA